MQYAYDAADRRVIKNVDYGDNGTGEVSEGYIYQGENALLVYDVSARAGNFPPDLNQGLNHLGSTTDNRPVSIYLWGDRPDQLLAGTHMKFSLVGDLEAMPHWYTTDHQGSVRGQLDEDGAPIGSYVYDAFGNLDATAVGTGVGLPDGAVDPYWTLDDDDDPSTPSTTPDPAYVGHGSGFPWVLGQFVSPTENGSSISGRDDYFYEATVTSQVEDGTISGFLAADNEVVEVFINGDAAGISVSDPAFGGWHAFTLSGLVQGENIVSFHVKDVGGVITGLAVRWGGEASRFLYTGQEHDRETGLNYYGARFYDPASGRFLTQDPAREGMSWQAYVGNNPMNLTDPSGLRAFGGTGGSGISSSPLNIVTGGSTLSGNTFTAIIGAGGSKNWSTSGAYMNTDALNTAFSPVAKPVYDVDAATASMPSRWRSLGQGFRNVAQAGINLLTGAVNAHWETRYMDMGLDYRDAPQVDPPQLPMVAHQYGGRNNPFTTELSVGFAEFGLSLVAPEIAMRSPALARGIATFGNRMIGGAVRGLEAVDQMLPQLAGMQTVVPMSGRQQVIVAPKGGPYDKVRAGNIGGQVHHTPAVTVTPYSRAKGPSVWMETADHKLTKSWGSSANAQAYRQQQAELIKQGKLRNAIQMDIDDIRSKFGNKYNENIRQMLDSFGFSD